MELVAEKYKPTELGTIPEDWNLLEFQEVMDGFSSGQTPYRGKPEFYTGNIPWITSGELNYNVITDTKEKITPEGVQDANLKIIPKGTFLFAITGLEAAGTRGSCAITGIEATTNQSCMALYPKKGLLITPYLYHFYVRYGNDLAFKYCQGTKQQSFTGGIAKKLPIIVPPNIEEQTAIATALSDADALISSLEKLIAKKRMIKQGAMQQLLQPKEGWEVKKLGEVGTIVTGSTPPTQIKEYWNGSIPWITPTDISINQKDIFHSEREITNAGLQAIRKLPANTLLVTCIASIGKNAILRNEGACNQQINAIIPNAGYSVDYLYFLIENSKSYIIGKAGITATMMISKNEFSEIVYAFPDFNQQSRISTILSDMDAEIDALETKLEKYKKIKLGMMQNLLTGKIRLI